MRRLLSLALAGLMLGGCATTAADLRAKHQVPSQVTDSQLEDQYAACVDHGEEKAKDYTAYGLATAVIAPLLLLPLSLALGITGASVSHGTRANCMTEWASTLRESGPAPSEISVGPRPMSLAPASAQAPSTSRPEQPIGQATGEARQTGSVTTASVAPRVHTKAEEPAGRNASTPEAAQRGPTTLSASSPVTPQPAPTVAPRLTADGKTLILLEEISEPAWKRQPQIDLGTDPSTGTPQLRVGARGMKAAPDIGVVCGTATHWLSLTVFTETATRSVAKYEVPKGTVATMLASSTCRVALLGIVLPIPQRELSIVWSRPPSTSGSRTAAPSR
jgi:hypothetical protein